MQFLEASGRKELQKFAKEYGIKANIKSDEIREQLLKKGFAAPRQGSSHPKQANDNQPENQAPVSPEAPSNAETKLQGLQSRMKRRNALHVRNGDPDTEVGTQPADANPGKAVVTKNQRHLEGATQTPVRNRASTASKYYTPMAGQSDATSSATVFGTPAQTLEPSSQSSKPPGARGIPSSPPPPPPHLATPVSKQPSTQPRAGAGIPSKRADIKVSTPSAAPAPAGPSYLPRSPVNSISGESLSPQPPSQTANTSPAQPANHIADVPATAAALQRLKNARTGNRPAVAVPVPSHLLADTSEHIAQVVVAQPNTDARSGIPTSSPPPKQPGTAPAAVATASPVSPSIEAASSFVSSDGTNSDAVRPSSSNGSFGRAPRQVPVHLKKTAGGAGSNRTGSDAAGDTKQAAPSRPVRDTLGLSKRRKPMHAQPGRTSANASVPPVPPHSTRSQSGQDAGAQKAKSMGAGIKEGEVSPPIRISRSPAPRRGAAGRGTSAKRRMSSDRAAKRGNSDDGGEKAPQWRSISVEPRLHASRSRIVPRGSGIARRSTSAIGVSSESSRDKTSSPGKESSKTSVGTSGNGSAPGSVAATVLGGSPAERIGRSGLVQRGAVAESSGGAAAPATAAPSALPRRSLSPTPAFSVVSFGATDAQLDQKKGPPQDLPSAVAHTQAAGSRLPRLSPSPSPTKQQLRAQLAAAGELPSGGFVFPMAAVRESSADTPTFAEHGDEGESFAFGSVTPHPADSTGLIEWQNIPKDPQDDESVPLGAQPGDSSSRPFDHSGSRAFASRLDESNPPSPPSLRLPDQYLAAKALPPVSEAAPVDFVDAPSARGAAAGRTATLGRSKSGRSRLPVDAPLPSQLKNRMKMAPPAPPGPSLAGAAAASRAQRVSEASASEPRSRVSSANGNDLLALYGSTDLSSDAGRLSRVNTGNMDDEAGAATTTQRPRSPLSKTNPAAATLATAAAMVAAGKDHRGAGMATWAHVQQRSFSAFATDPAGGSTDRMGGSSTSGSSVPGHSRGCSASTTQGISSAVQEVAGQVWNPSASDFDAESASGMAKLFKSSSTTDGAGGLHLPLGTAASAGVGTLPSDYNVTGMHSQNRSTSALQNTLSSQPRMRQHRNIRLEHTAQWLNVRNRELQDLELSMRELNQNLLAGGTSGDLPGPALANPGDASGALTGQVGSGSVSLLNARGATAEGLAGGSCGTRKGGVGESASMAQKYAEMEAELAQLPPRRRRTAAGAAQHSVSMSMDGFLMAERLANGGSSASGQHAPDHGHSVSMPGQSALDRIAQQASAHSSSQFASSDGSSIGGGSSNGSGLGGIGGLLAANRAVSRSPMGRIGKPSVGSMLSPLPEKSKWAEPVRPTGIGYRRTFGNGSGSIGIASAVAESLIRQKQQIARQGLRAPKAGRVGAPRSRSANPTPFRGAAAASEFPAGFPRGLTEANRGSNSAGVLAEPARPRPSGLTQSVGAARGPGRVASAGTKFQTRIGGSMGTGVAAPGSPYLASPVTSKTGVARARSVVGALRTPNVKPRSGTMACNRKR